MNEELLPHQQRVLEERTELNYKITKLNIFSNTETFNDLHIGDKSLLINQIKTMIMYRNILDKRIERFNYKA